MKKVQFPSKPLALRKSIDSDSDSDSAAEMPGLPADDDDASASECIY